MERSAPFVNVDFERKPYYMCGCVDNHNLFIFLFDHTFIDELAAAEKKHAHTQLIAAQYEDIPFKDGVDLNSIKKIYRIDTALSKINQINYIKPGIDYKELTPFVGINKFPKLYYSASLSEDGIRKDYILLEYHLLNPDVYIEGLSQVKAKTYQGLAKSFSFIFWDTLGGSRLGIDPKVDERRIWVYPRDADKISYKDECPENMFKFLLEAYEE